MIEQSKSCNGFLQCLDPEDFQLLAVHFELATLSVRQVLIQEKRPIPYVYFPTAGICSVVVSSADKKMIEVAMLGREGTTDMVLEPGRDRSLLKVFVRAPGAAWRMNATAYATAVRQSHSLLVQISRYQQAAMTQMAYTALAIGSYDILQRLARWVLMAQDRVGDRIPVVHDLMASMLAVRRAGITEAIHLLEGEGAIKSTRALVQVLDREKLLAIARGSYGAPESEYERLVGPMPRRDQL